MYPRRQTLPRKNQTLPKPTISSLGKWPSVLPCRPAVVVGVDFRVAWPLPFFLHRGVRIFAFEAMDDDEDDAPAVAVGRGRGRGRGGVAVLPAGMWDALTGNGEKAPEPAEAAAVEDAEEDAESAMPAGFGRGENNRAPGGRGAGGRGMGGGRGAGGRGMGGGRGREGRGRGMDRDQRGQDWDCPACTNTNWSWRGTCNQCNTAKPASLMVRPICWIRVQCILHIVNCIRYCCLLLLLLTYTSPLSLTLSLPVPVPCFSRKQRCATSKHRAVYPVQRWRSMMTALTTLGVGWVSRTAQIGRLRKRRR
jgi:hypothetical protein